MLITELALIASTQTSKLQSLTNVLVKYLVTNVWDNAVYVLGFGCGNEMISDEWRSMVLDFHSTHRNISCSITCHLHHYAF